MDIAVWNHHSIFLTQYILPRAYWRFALTNVNIAWLAIIVAESAVWLLHNVRSPYHFGCGPVHYDVLPVYKVFAYPHLCRAIAIACAIGSGIEIIDIAKLTDCRICEISWNKRICRRWVVMETGTWVCDRRSQSPCQQCECYYRFLHCRYCFFRITTNPPPDAILMHSFSCALMLLFSMR